MSVHCFNNKKNILLYFMTYSEEERQKLRQLVEVGTSWEGIGIALGKSPAAVERYWHRKRLTIDLPPKPVVRHSIFTPRIKKDV